MESMFLHQCVIPKQVTKKQPQICNRTEVKRAMINHYNLVVKEKWNSQKL